MKNKVLTTLILGFACLPMLGMDKMTEQAKKALAYGQQVCANYPTTSKVALIGTSLGLGYLGYKWCSKPRKEDFGDWEIITAEEALSTTSSSTSQKVGEESPTSSSTDSGIQAVERLSEMFAQAKKIATETRNILGGSSSKASSSMSQTKEEDKNQKVGEESPASSSADEGIQAVEKLSEMVAQAKKIATETKSILESSSSTASSSSSQTKAALKATTVDIAFNEIYEILMRTLRFEVENEEAMINQERKNAFPNGDAHVEENGRKLIQNNLEEVYRILNDNSSIMQQILSHDNNFLWRFFAQGYYKTNVFIQHLYYKYTTSRDDVLRHAIESILLQLIECMRLSMPPEKLTNLIENYKAYGDNLFQAVLTHKNCFLLNAINENIDEIMKFVQQSNLVNPTRDAALKAIVQICDDLKTQYAQYACSSSKISKQ